MIIKEEPSLNDIDNNILFVEFEYYYLPVPSVYRITVSDETHDQIAKIIEEKASPSPKLKELMNRKPRYKKEF